jgi:hypothetical protein
MDISIAVNGAAVTGADLGQGLTTLLICAFVLAMVCFAWCYKAQLALVYLVGSFGGLLALVLYGMIKVSFMH